MRHRFTFIIGVILFAAVALAPANAVPAGVSYQGKLAAENGAAVPDGEYTLVFSLYPSAAGAGAPLWQSPPVQVTTADGVFSTVLAPPASILATDDLWLQTRVEGLALSPLVKLHSVPFAVRAGEAALVPDGSISAAKLGPDVHFAAPDYQTGILSGLPRGVLRVLIDGIPTDPPAVLAKPYSEGAAAVRYRPGVDPFEYPYYLPGTPHAGAIVVRRPVSRQQEWAKWASDAAAGRPSAHEVLLILTDGRNEYCRWSASECFVSQYELVVGDDGRPMEQIALEVHPPGLLRQRGPIPKDLLAVAPSGGERRGFVSQLPAGTQYIPVFDGKPFPEYQIASDTGFGSGYVYYQGGTGRRLKIPGEPGTTFPTLRQNPAAPDDLYKWYQSIRTPNLIRKDLVLTLDDGNGTSTLLTCVQAWPHQYTLRIADDGLPVEEFIVTYESPQLPKL